jgi:hypothetical protein
MGSEVAKADTSEILLIRLRGLNFINLVILRFGDISIAANLDSYAMGRISGASFFSKDFLVMPGLGDV